MQREELQARVDQLQSINRHLQLMAVNMQQTVSAEEMINVTTSTLRNGLAMLEGRLTPGKELEIEEKLRTVPPQLLLAALVELHLRGLQQRIDGNQIGAIDPTEAGSLAKESLRNAIVANIF